MIHWGTNLPTPVLHYLFICYAVEQGFKHTKDQVLVTSCTLSPVAEALSQLYSLNHY